MRGPHVRQRSGRFSAVSLLASAEPLHGAVPQGGPSIGAPLCQPSRRQTPLRLRKRSNRLAWERPASCAPSRMPTRPGRVLELLPDALYPTCISSWVQKTRITDAEGGRQRHRAAAAVGAALLMLAVVIMILWSSTTEPSPSSIRLSCRNVELFDPAFRKPTAAMRWFRHARGALGAVAANGSITA